MLEYREVFWTLNIMWVKGGKDGRVGRMCNETEQQKIERRFLSVPLTCILPDLKRYILFSTTLGLQLPKAQILNYI